MATTIAKSLVSVGTKAIGDLVGNTIADSIFGSRKITHGKRIHHVKDIRLSEEEIIPNIYGKVQLAGSILWMSDINEYVKVEKKRSKSGEATHSEYTYTVSLAIGLCEGPISSVGRIWVDGILINKRNVRIYYGSDDQEVDPLLEALYSDEAPAFRGLAYAVIQEFDITEFGNKIPNFTFELIKNSMDESSIEYLVESMVIIPGCGEFVYDTDIHTEKVGNEIISINQHHTPGVANSVVSLEQLKETFPNVGWVAPVVSWFGTSLNAGDCKVVPKVEKKNVSYESDEWKVGNINRQNAESVLSIGDKINYGGTPSDGSIVRYLKHIKSQGLECMFYPMLFVDVPGKPWRGRINAISSEDVQNFFNGENGYNKFILHYANLVKDYVSAFLIGSEMQDLTKFKDENGNYLAVDELIKLAGKVKSILGDKVKVSYAANWSEYHSVNGEYYMDKLWASKNIDFVGIDAYFPLSNDCNSQYDVQKIIKGWDSGELYDYYYDGNKAMPLSPQYAMKNIEFWWSNKHYNSDGNPTDWEPKMKKIWFTEYGFASISCATNEPNVFVDSSTSESNLPKHSTGEIDILAQRIAIQGTEMRWHNSESVERRFLWTWDARPYPTWPQLKDIWSDGDSWERGHWINGKGSGVELKSVVKDICIKSGIDNNLINVKNLHGIVHGLVIEGNQSGKSILSDLQKAYNFNMYEGDGKINFCSRNSNSTHKLNYDEFLCQSSQDEIDFGDNETPIKTVLSDDMPEVVLINYISQDFTIKKYEFNPDDEINKKVLTIDLPLIMSDEDAKNITRNIFRNTNNSNIKYKFKLAIDTLFGHTGTNIIQPGDILKVTYKENELTMRIESLDICQDNTVKLICCKDPNTTSYNLQLNINNNIDNQQLHEFIPESAFEIIKIPHQPFIAIAASGLNKKWYGCQVGYTTKNQVISENYIKIDKPSIIGCVISFENNWKQDYFTIDNQSRLRVKLYQGQLFSIAKSDLFTEDKNMIVVGDEIMKFSNASLQPDGTYILSGLIRGIYGTRSETFDRFILLDRDILKQIDIDSSVDQINFNIKTFLDKKYIRLTDKVQEKNFVTGKNLLSPVKLTQYKNKIEWTPRMITSEFFNDKIDYGFCIKFTDKNNQVIKQIYTIDNNCEIPSDILNNLNQVMVAAFKDNKVRSDFISMTLEKY